MKSFLAGIIALGVSLALSPCAEVQTTGRESLVKEQVDEVLRKQFEEALGDLSNYSFLWINPDGFVHIAAILEKEENNQHIHEVLFWRKGLKKEQIVVTRLSDHDAKTLFDSIDRLFESALKPSIDQQDEENPERVFMFKRYKNVDVFDWHTISVRPNSKNEDFRKIRSLMMPKVAEPDTSDFFGKKNE